MEDFEIEIKKEFLNEALMNLEEVEGSFMELESTSDSKPLLDKIFRLAHNLKGGSRAVGFGEVAELTHQLESLVLKIQKNEIALSPAVITVLLQSNDRLMEMLIGLKKDITAQFDNANIITNIQNWLDGKVDNDETEKREEVVSPLPLDLDQTVSSLSSLPVPQAEEFFLISDERAADSTNAIEVESLDKKEFVVDQIKTENLAQDLPANNLKEINREIKNKKEVQKEDEIIRVSLEKINLLNDYVGELIVFQSVVQQQSQVGNKIKLDASIRQMMKLSKDIQNLSMSLRMLPVRPLVQKLQRVVRDTAQILQKEIRLHVEGEQMDIDKSVLDHLSDPLIHILRNAADHGVESPHDRVVANKPTQGNIFLSFMNEGNHLVIEVKDDGKGIDGEILRKKAIEKRIINENQKMSEKQLIHLIFHPGFSTKSETSEISGRGVGMDVVKTNVEKIGGQIDILTNVGKGSLFRLQIPLSLAVVEGLVVTTESNRYVIPISQVQETVNLKSRRIHADKVGVGTCFELRGAVVPLFSLEGTLSNKRISIKEEGIALIINVEDRAIAIVVDEILFAQQIVIKPFSHGILAQKGWVGTCVLGDGLPTLILNPVDLFIGKIIDSFKESNVGGMAA